MSPGEWGSLRWHTNWRGVAEGPGIDVVCLFLFSLTIFLVQNSFGDGGLGGVFRCFSGIFCVKPF